MTVVMSHGPVGSVDAPVVTEVIGWGDEEERPGRLRIRWRPPRWAVAIVVVIGLAAVVVVPPMRARLARDAAGWLASAWGERSSYDDARDVVVEGVGARAAVGDGRVAEQITTDMDLAEAGALSHLADSIGTHRTWAGDVRTAADTAVKALRSEVTALRADAAGHPLVAPFYAGEQTGALITAADAAVQAAVRRHHAKPATPARVRLPAPAQLLHRLTEPTDVSTGLGLVLALRHHRVIFDLDTGHVTPLPGVTGMAAAVGSRVVGQTQHGAFLFDLATGARRRLTPNRTAWPFAEGGGSFWLASGRGYRRFTDTGGPLGPWYRQPRNQPYISMAQDAATITFDRIGRRFVPELWDPATDRRVRLRAQCLGQTGSGGDLFVLLGCGNHRTASVVDARSGRERTVAVPPHAFIADLPQSVSPDGRYLAVQIGARSGVVDLSSGHVVIAPGPSDIAPSAWSPDGRWLLLSQPDLGSSGGAPRVGLWRVGSSRLEPVRLPSSVTDQPGYLSLVQLH